MDKLRFIFGVKTTQLDDPLGKGDIWLIRADSHGVCEQRFIAGN
jgi:hypothetical protein